MSYLRLQSAIQNPVRQTAQRVHISQLVPLVIDASTPILVTSSIYACVYGGNCDVSDVCVPVMREWKAYSW